MNEGQCQCKNSNLGECVGPTGSENVKYYFFRSHIEQTSPNFTTKSWYCFVVDIWNSLLPNSVSNTNFSLTSPTVCEARKHFTLEWMIIWIYRSGHTVMMREAVIGVGIEKLFQSTSDNQWHHWSFFISTPSTYHHETENVVSMVVGPVRLCTSTCLDLYLFFKLD